MVYPNLSNTLGLSRNDFLMHEYCQNMMFIKKYALMFSLAWPFPHFRGILVLLLFIYKQPIFVFGVQVVNINNKLI